MSYSNEALLFHEGTAIRSLSKRINTLKPYLLKTYSLCNYILLKVKTAARISWAIDQHFYICNIILLNQSANNDISSFTYYPNI